MSVSTRRGRAMLRCSEVSRLLPRFGTALFLLLVGIALPAGGQDQPFAHIDDDLLRLTPVNRQLDYVRFQPSLGSLKPLQPPTELFSFDIVLLPPATYVDDDADSAATRHLATASDIRRSVIPQINPHATISLLLYRNGETPLDSDEGQAGFRSNGPSVIDAMNPDAEIPRSGS